MKTEVIVNGKQKDIEYRVCGRCVQDSTVPGIQFDHLGVCNYCHLHDDLCESFPNDERGEKYLEKLFEKIKAQGKGKKFDCVVGISGGRDSTYLLYKAVKDWGLRPIAVHFNDGFDNPVAGENMLKAVKKLGVELRTITSDWREGKDLKLTLLKASTPDLNLGTDIGIASAIYGVAHKEGIKHILIGQSFRTEGVKPLSWSYFDGDYLRNLQKKFGSVKLRPWQANSPNFNFGVKELFYYSVIKRIKGYTPFYSMNYVRTEAEEILKKELDWVYPGAHYFDDLYHSLIKYVHRVKFNIDLNMNSDSALVRSGQLNRKQALERAHGVYKIEKEEIIELCINRLGISREEFESYIKLEPKTFKAYPTSYPYIKLARWPIYILSRLHLIPRVAYDKYFKFVD